MRLLVLNGPNLNVLGTREPDIYGGGTLADLEAEIRAALPEVTFAFAQSNHEGVLLDHVHAAAADGTDGLVVNFGALSHTSIALRDALAAVRPLPAVEVHISNVHARESFRHTLLTAGACVGVVSGLGRAGYALAARFLVGHIEAQRAGAVR